MKKVWAIFALCALCASFAVSQEGPGPQLLVETVPAEKFSTPLPEGASVTVAYLPLTDEARIVYSRAVDPSVDLTVEATIAIRQAANWFIHEKVPYLSFRRMRDDTTKYDKAGGVTNYIAFMKLSGERLASSLRTSE
jgi:hypothetical protein